MIRRVLLVVLLVVLVLGGWAAYRAYRVQADLQAAKSDAVQLQDALEAQDVDRAQEALGDLEQHSRAAADGSSGPTWSVLGHTPVVGDDLAAVAVLSRTLADLSSDGLAPLLDVAQAYDEGKFTPRRGRIPVDELAKLQQPVAASAASFAAADKDLAGLVGSYVGPINEARDTLQDAVDEGSKRLIDVEAAVELLPPMLGADGPRQYLLVLQNNAEIRSTGGFPGSTFILTADDGRISLGDSVAGRFFQELPDPIEPLTPAELTLFGERAGTRFVDTNTIPDFPRAAGLMQAMYEAKYDDELDGVLSADPVLLSYLLEGREPIEAQGVQITSENAVQELLNGTYLRFTDPDQQDLFFRQVGETVFGSLTGTSDPEQMIDALRRGAREGRLLAVSTHPAEQRRLTERGLTGALPSHGTRPEMGIYLNDRTGQYGSKLSYYLRYTPMAATTCRDGVPWIRGSLTLTNTAPRGAVGLPDYVSGVPSEGEPLGAEGLWIYLVGPRGGRVATVEVDGEPLSAVTADYRGRPVARVELSVPAGSSSEIAWTAAGTRGQRGPVDLALTPPITGGDGVGASATVGACE